MDLVGRTLAEKWQVLRPLGQGGMGIVYEARDLRLDRRVALKTLLDDDPRSLARFQQEAGVMAAVKHPNIAEVFDFQRLPDAPPFIVMELVTGQSLGTLLRREGRLPLERALRIAAQMLDALGAAHRAGIVHRDVKPGNVLLTNDGDVKLVDFGIAKVLGGGGVKTTTGAVLGTPAYLAPEQILGGAIDARTDVHAVGLVLYEMITGRRMSREPTPSFADVPEHIAAAIARATSKVKEDRFASADAMKAALASSSPPSRARQFAIAFGATLLVAAVASSAYVLTRPKPPPVVVASPSAVPSQAPIGEPAENPQPEAPAPDDASVDASAPAKPARDDTKPKCWCVNRLSNGNLGARLCLQKEPASCRCSLESGGAICRELRDDGSCKNVYAWTGKDDDPCTGTLVYSPRTIAMGKMQCEYCYHYPMPGVRAVQNAPCTGYEPGGKLVKGIWRCE